MTLSDQDAANLVEWLSEIGDLSYMAAPDPDSIGVGIRLRVQSCKHLLNADTPPVPAMPRIMYDSVNWQAIPANAQFVAGYIDGPESQWPAEAWVKFPNAKRITVLGDTAADIADCENGDLTPEKAADWFKQTGKIVYLEASGVADIVALGVPVSSLWVADWTWRAHLYPGSWATQYTNSAASGGDYDLSLLSKAA